MAENPEVPEGNADSSDELDEFRGEIQERYPEEEPEAKEPEESKGRQQDESADLEEFREGAAEKYPSEVDSS